MSKIAIRGCRLIDGTGVPPIEDVTILIEGKKIVSVGRSGQISIPAGAKVIDAGGMTVMPGMIDLHVHLGWVTDDPKQPNLDLATRGVPIQLRTMYTYRNAKRLLKAGFTTVRDPGGWEVEVGVKRAIEHGIVIGPTIVAYKGFSATEYAGADAHRKKVRELILETGVDGIKVATSGSCASLSSDITWRMRTFEEMFAVCDEAHALGNKRVAVHSYMDYTTKIAVEAGVDTVEHGPFISDDPELVKMMVKKGTYWIPTLLVYSHRGLQDTEKKWIPEFRRQKARRAWENGKKNFKILHEAGVKIAMGTDAARHFHHFDDNAWELELMVERGMTPMEAIVSTTKTASEALGEPWQSQIGTIESGKHADLIIVDGDPLKDIKILQERQRIKKVLKEGALVVER